LVEFIHLLVEFMGMLLEFIARSIRITKVI
jgi:hypothetical protein